MENEPNFKESKVLQVTAAERFTSLFSQKETNPNEPNTNPNEPNFIPVFGGYRCLGLSFHLWLRS